MVKSINTNAVIILLPTFVTSQLRIVTSIGYFHHQLTGNVLSLTGNNLQPRGKSKDHQDLLPPVWIFITALVTLVNLNR
jgi:hypothetical protein